MGLCMYETLQISPQAAGNLHYVINQTGKRDGINIETQIKGIGLQRKRIWG